MTSQTNEEINVKGKHLPHIWIYSRYSDVEGMGQYVSWEPENRNGAPEYLSREEHNEIVSTYKDLLKMKDNSLNAKDAEIADLKRVADGLEVTRTYIEKEIAELKAYKDQYQERSQETHAVCIHAMSVLESKLARAVEALDLAIDLWPTPEHRHDEELYAKVVATFADISATPVLADKPSYVFGQEVEDK
jgi:hypothetical protein